jgi:RNA polymerase sigma factor (sigma-70 family)
MALRYGNWRVPAEDLMQEGRIAAWEAERTYDGRGSFRAYALMAARAAMLTAISEPFSNRVDRAFVSYDQAENPERYLSGRDFVPMLIEALCPPEAPAKPADLSAREIEILRAVCGGLSAADAADRLCIQVSTVNFHLTNAYRKLGAVNLVQAYNCAMAKGLIDPPKRVK